MALLHQSWHTGQHLKREEPCLLLPRSMLETCSCSLSGMHLLLQEREAKRQKLKEEGAAAFIGASPSGTSSRDQPEEPVRPRVGTSKQHENTWYHLAAHLESRR